MRYLFLSLLFLIIVNTFAQQPLPVPRNIQAAYDKGTRSLSGEPGRQYWQNTADYDLAIQYFPDTRLLTGKAGIDYINNSPDTLTEVWFKLYPNLYQKGAPRDRPISEADINEGLIIDQLSINGKPAGRAAFEIMATNMVVQVPATAKGQPLHFEISYHYTLNKVSHVRTGEIEPGAAFIAYFFPRIAVYDDVDGWNKIPYQGSLEFYNDFGRFKAAITVPNDYIVWATGDLKNGADVLQPVYHQRLQQAEQKDGFVNIVDTTDLGVAITKKAVAFNTWRFEAAEVPDFVFAVSNHYVWQSSSLVVDPTTQRRTRVDAAFNPKHKDYFHVVSDARKTVEAMSYRFPAWPYPYSHISVFDGLDQMEYPMMVNDNPVENRHESIELTDNEIFHTMFPFYMGINETKYPWMDEGWATIGEWLISPMIDSSIVDEYAIEPYARAAGNEEDVPVTTVHTAASKGYFYNAYGKPGMGYLYIKDYLGDALFTKALHHYIRSWHGKHPLPLDFFYSMNAGAGKNMNWFWKKWFYEEGMPDLAIGSVRKSGQKYTVSVAAKGSKPVPVDLIIYYADGTTEKLHRSIAVWEKGATHTVLSFTAAKVVAKLELRDPHTPDSNRKDNVWVEK